MSAWIVPGDGDTRHGTVNGYRNLHCNCDDCMAAMARYIADWRSSREPLPPGDARHGTRNGYVSYGCRCVDCSTAHADYMRRYRLAERAS